MLKARGRRRWAIGRLAGRTRPAWLLVGALLLLATAPETADGFTWPGDTLRRSTTSDSGSGWPVT